MEISPKMKNNLKVYKSLHRQNLDNYIKIINIKIMFFLKSKSQQIYNIFEFVL